MTDSASDCLPSAASRFCSRTLTLSHLICAAPKVLFSTRFDGYTVDTFGPQQRERFLADFLAAAVRTTGLPIGEPLDGMQR